MSVPRPIEPTERAAILADLRTGKSIGYVAKKYGRGQTTVWHIADDEGILNHPPPKSAIAANRDYAKGARLALLNQGFTQAEEMLPDLTTPLELKNWTIAVAVLCDKRRLEEGLSTERLDVADAGQIHDRLLAKLEDLASRQEPGNEEQPTSG